MPNGFGRGRSADFSLRGGMGFGFRGASPPWPYVGLGRGGLPRCGYFFSGSGAPATSGYAPFFPQMTREGELDYLKSQAEAVKGQLEQIEARIEALEGRTKA
jgi:hypothetical protein